MGKLFIFIGILFFLISCNTVSEEILGNQNPGIPDSTGFQTASAGGVILKYRLDGDNLHCRLSSSTSGWIAAGFNPSDQMKDANFIIGYVENEVGQIRDDWGSSNVSHQSDESLGGNSDVSLISAEEEEGTTVLEFTLPLNSGDMYDRVLNPGNSYPIILARGNSDDFTGYHSSLGLTEIYLLEEDRD